MGAAYWAGGLDPALLLPSAGREGADAAGTGWAGSRSSRARFNASTLTRLLPTIALPTILSPTRASTLARSSLRAPATRAHLDGRVGRRDVRVEAGGRGRHGVGRHGLVRAAAEGRDGGLHPIEQLLRGRPEVRARGIGRIVGRVDRLGRVLRIGRAGGRGAAVEVAVGREVLADEARSRPRRRCG